MPFLPPASPLQNAVIPPEAAHNRQLKFPNHDFLLVNFLLMQQSEALTLRGTLHVLTLSLKDLRDML